ncbi:neutrophil gelatinase-associated lipocalin-like [Erethizon dorsatum]
MALGVLWLGLTLLMLQTQGQDFPLGMNLGPPLSKVPLQKRFKDDQEAAKQPGISMVTEAGADKQQGREWSQPSLWGISPQTRAVPGAPNGSRSGHNCCRGGGKNPQGYHGLQSYTMRVAATDYNKFALVYFKMIFKNNVSFEATLYGRTKELSPELKERFIKFAKSLGFTEDNVIFTDPIGKDSRLTWMRHISLTFFEHKLCGPNGHSNQLAPLLVSLMVEEDTAQKPHFWKLEWGHSENSK